MSVLDNKYFRLVWFNFVFYGTNIFLSVLLLPFLAAPRQIAMKAIRFWLRGVAFMEDHFGGISYFVIGKENIPKTQFIAACKHQSEWETFKIHLILNDPAIVIKKELLNIPVVGWHIRKSDPIPLDRRKGTKAIKLMIQKARKAVKEGRSIFIFPEGTRVGLNEQKPYKSGIAALYQDLNLPIVPMALNSGLLWAKNSMFKKRGHITVQFLPIIEAGLPKEEMMQRLRDSIETAVKRLS